MSKKRFYVQLSLVILAGAVCGFGIAYVLSPVFARMNQMSHEAMQELKQKPAAKSAPVVPPSAPTTKP